MEKDSSVKLQGDVYQIKAEYKVRETCTLLYGGKHLREQKREDPREGKFMVKTPQCGSKFLNQM